MNRYIISHKPEVTSVLKIILIISILFSFNSISYAAFPNAPVDLTCEEQYSPADIYHLKPMFHWVFSDSDEEDEQGYYRILISTSTASLNNNIGEIWDSGKNAEPWMYLDGFGFHFCYIHYEGSLLNIDTTYFWKVMTWDNLDSSGPYSGIQTFHTNKMETPSNLRTYEHHCGYLSISCDLSVREATVVIERSVDGINFDVLGSYCNGCPCLAFECACCNEYCDHDPSSKTTNYWYRAYAVDNSGNNISEYSGKVAEFGGATFITKVECDELPQNTTIDRIKIDEDTDPEVLVKIQKPEYIAELVQGSVYNFEAKNGTDTVNITGSTIIISYFYRDSDNDGKDDVTGYTIDSLHIFYYNGHEWEKLDSTIDSEENAVQATVTHLSKYCLMSIIDQNNLIHSYWNYPNPFGNEGTVFCYDLNNNPGDLSVKIYSTGGRLITQLEADENSMKTGYNEIPWNGKDQNGTDLASGVYIYRISATFGEYTIYKTGKIVIMK